jgi:hypothetical protein
VSLFAISDIHLSFGVENKDMCIFEGWYEHHAKLRKNWNRVVKAGDTVIIAGDISWGKTLEQTRADLDFIDRQLTGRKLLLKGNHDYWWNTLAKMRLFIFDQNMNNIDFLHNNSFKADEYAICGACGHDDDEGLMLRAAGRLETSILAGRENGGEPLVFMHYPPVTALYENRYVLEILRKYAIKRVFSGHIHQSGFSSAFIGEKYGIRFDTISADYLNFTPKIIL